MKDAKEKDIYDLESLINNWDEISIVKEDLVELGLLGSSSHVDLLISFLIGEKDEEVFYRRR